MAVVQDRSFAARLVGWAYDGYGAAFRALSAEKASALGGNVLRALGPNTPTHRVALTNLAIAFPDLSDRARADIAVEAWDNFGRLIGEFPHLNRMSVYEDDAPISVVGAEKLDAITRSDRGAVLISGHFANWEVMAMAIVRRGTPCRVTYRQANNYFIDQRIVSQRAAYGIRLQAAKGKQGGMGLLRALAKGEAVAVMNDQKYNEGVAAPLFGRDAMTADGPTRLARRFGCPLVPMSVKRLPRARFRVTVHDPISVDTSADDTAAVTATVKRINAFMEQRIFEAPSEWFWVHRRFEKPLYKRA